MPPLVEQGKQLVNYVLGLYDNREGMIGSLQDLANQYGLVTTSTRSRDSYPPCQRDWPQRSARSSR